MKPEIQRILAPHAAVYFKSKLSFHPTANLLSSNVFANIYFGEDEWNDEFGPFVRLLTPFMGLTAKLWPPDKEKDGHMLLCVEGRTEFIASDPEIDLNEIDLDPDKPPNLEYENAKMSLDLSWYVVRLLARLDDIYDIQECRLYSENRDHRDGE